MQSAYERHLVVSYLANAAERLHHRDPEASRLVEWANERKNRVACWCKGLLERMARADIEPDERISARQMRHVRQVLRDERATRKRAKFDRTARRIRLLGKATGLSPVDVGILELLLRYHTQQVIESMVDDIFGRYSGRRRPFNVRSEALSALLGVSANAVSGRFAAAAPLIRSGLITVDDDGDFGIVGRLRRLATAPGRDDLGVSRLLLNAAPSSELEWADFDHIAEHRDYIERLLKGALKEAELGVNILLYGPPGTGKTEFCKVLAARLGVTLYSVGEADDEGDEPNRRERLQELRLSQRLLARDRRSLVLFDEMEDLLSGAAESLSFLGRPFFSGDRNDGSKVFMHRLLERAPTPTLWTMNDARRVSPALLRRMMFAVELRPPTAAVRERIWVRQLEHHGIEAGPDEAHALAREFAATPGVAAGATAAARIGGGGIDTVRHGVRGLSRVLSCEAPPQGTPPLFDPALIRADTDPVALAVSLEGSGDRRFSLCLQGPPGTGKSAFVRYLAERMGLEVMQKRTSDLMSMWLGETEKKIAAAFAEARDTGAFLVFDEAGSLLADRRFAHRSWEVSQVNEMLTWMESHPQPFACTTNFGAHLDAATLRRFVFKVTLDYLSPAQVAAAFRTYFSLAPPAGVTALTALTPGDFAVVRRKVGHCQLNGGG